MRDYQRSKNNKYILPTAVYHQTLWQIRDYYRLKAEADAILEASPAPPDGQPRGTDISDMVANKAERRENTLAKIKILDDNKMAIPEEYREGIWNNIQFGSAYPLDADRTTYGRYKSMFVFNVAKDFYLL